MHSFIFSTAFPLSVEPLASKVEASESNDIELHDVMFETEVAEAEAGLIESQEVGFVVFDDDDDEEPNPNQPIFIPLLFLTLRSTT